MHERGHLGTLNGQKLGEWWQSSSGHVAAPQISRMDVLTNVSSDTAVLKVLAATHSTPSPQSQYLLGDDWWRVEGATEVTAWIFVAMWTVYAIAVIWHDVREYAAEREAGKETLAHGQTQTVKLEEGGAAEATTVPKAEPQSSAPAKERVPLWDLCKFIAHVFVQYTHFGHKLSMGYTNLMWMHEPVAWSSAWKMSTFVFISGVFGQSFSRDALTKMACYGVAAPLFITLLYYIVCLVVGVILGVLVFPTGPQPNHIWYPFAMIVWRLALVPFRNVSSRKGVPYWISFATVVVASYFARHILGQHVASTSGLYLSFGYRYVQDVLVFSPFYYAGLYMSHREWTQLLLSKPLELGATLTFVAWNLALSSHWWREVASISCMGYVTQCDCDHWPTTLDPPPVSAHSFALDLKDYAMKFVVTFAFIWTVAWSTAPLKSMFPSTMKYILDAGTRTMYGYLLHVPLFIVLGLRMGFPLLLRHVPPVLFPALGMLLCTISALLLCSRLTEKIFNRIVLPYWLRESCPCWACCI